MSDIAPIGYLVRLREWQAQLDERRKLDAEEAARLEAERLRLDTTAATRPEEHRVADARGATSSSHHYPARPPLELFYPVLVAPAPLEMPPPPPTDSRDEVRAVAAVTPEHGHAQRHPTSTRDELTGLSELAADTRLALLALDPEHPLRGPSPTD